MIYYTTCKRSLGSVLQPIAITKQALFLINTFFGDLIPAELLPNVPYSKILTKLTIAVRICALYYYREEQFSHLYNF